MNRMSQDKVLEAVTLFKRMDPQDTGKADYDSLEEVLNQEYPRANVYKLIKTMNSEMQEKLFSGEKISLQVLSCVALDSAFVVSQTSPDCSLTSSDVCI